jgi:hypothetical protein
MKAPAMVSQQQYDHLPLSEESCEASSAEKGFRRSSGPSLSRYTKIAALIGAAVVGLVAVFALGYASGYRSGGNTSEAPPAQTPAAEASSNCTEPLIRKEWRSLSKEEKKGYLDAFQCFIDSPSQLGMNGSLYDDFSWAHNLVAHSSEDFFLEHAIHEIDLTITRCSSW